MASPSEEIADHLNSFRLKPSLRPELRDLVEHVTPKYAIYWREIGILIGVHIQEILVIEHGHPTMLKVCCNKMFVEWLECDKHASWGQLLAAIDSPAVSKPFRIMPNIDVHSSVDGCNRQKLSSATSKAVISLKARYCNQPPPCANDFPELPVLQYVQLALVHKKHVKNEQHHLDDFTKHALLRERDVIHNIKEKLHSIEEIFYHNNKPCPSRILIEGGPGVGKSTLVYKICQEWSRGELLKEFQVVLLLMLRSFWNMSLKDAIQSLLGSEVCSELYESLGSNVMLILDGYDEMSASWQADPFLTNLLNSHELPNATLVIACRPHACVHLKGFERRIEVLGFDKEQIQEFVKNYISEDTSLSAKEFLKKLEMNPYISGLLHIPMCLAMIIEIYQHDRALPANPNLTELLKTFVTCMIVRQYEKYPKAEKHCDHDKHQIVSALLPDVPKEAVDMVFLLSKVAYHAFFKWQGVRNNDGSLKSPKIIFSEKELNQCGFTTIDGNGFFQTFQVHKLPRSTTTYNFINLTVQEFFCALYICLLPPDVQHTIIETHFEVFPYMFCYLYGLCKPLPSSMLQFVCSKLTDLEYANTNKNIAVFNCAIKCICESSNFNTKENISSLKINMSFQVLFAYDCWCISYLLCHFPVLQLKLWVCSIGDDGAEQLVKHIDSIGNIKVLDLHWNNFTSDGIEHIIKIVNFNIRSLAKIDLGRNPFKDEGIELLINALHCCDAVVEELSVWQCEISSKGAKHIATMLETNKTLRTLKMDGNNIGDEGTVALASVLSKSMLLILHLNHCGFSYHGAESLVNNLKTSCNKSMMVLYLQKNAITLRGARLMASLACDVKEIQIDEEYMDDDEIKDAYKR